jgi:hypothetical protein
VAFITTNILPLLKEHALRPFTGDVLCLGHPDVHVSRRNLEVLASIAGASLRPPTSDPESSVPSADTDAPVVGVDLFTAIGFDTVTSLDCSRYEGAAIQFDLNDPALPSDLIARFDVIIDHGTIEHVFHIPNVMRNIFGMLRVEGRVVHSSPGANFFDHGFYTFSPTFFHDFYTSNRWLINTIQVYQMERDHQAPPFFADYRPGFFDSKAYGGLNDKMYGTICIVTKTAQSTGDVCPAQHRYRMTPGWLADDQTLHSATEYRNHTSGVAT